MDSRFVHIFKGEWGCVHCLYISVALYQDRPSKLMCAHGCQLVIYANEWKSLGTVGNMMDMTCYEYYSMGVSICPYYNWCDHFAHPYPFIVGRMIHLKSVITEALTCTPSIALRMFVLRNVHDHTSLVSKYLIVNSFHASIVMLLTEARTHTHQCVSMKLNSCCGCL